MKNLLLIALVAAASLAFAQGPRHHGQPGPRGLQHGHHHAGKPGPGPQPGHKHAGKPGHGKYNDVCPDRHANKNTPHRGDGPVNVDLRDLRKKGEIYKGQDVGDAGLNTSNQNVSNRWNAKYRK